MENFALKLLQSLQIRLFSIDVGGEKIKTKASPANSNSLHYTKTDQSQLQILPKFEELYEVYTL